MQNRYVGDIGDFAKYSLLNALSEERKLGVAWYLYPDEGHNDDGKHTSYLDQPEIWRERSPDVFDGLKLLVRNDRRNVGEVVNRKIISPLAVADESLNYPTRQIEDRARWRKRWFERVQIALKNCDIVFADPDNGLCQNCRFSHATPKNWKRLPLDEAVCLAQGRMAIFYHHNSRFKGGHSAENLFWFQQLKNCSFAVRFRAYSARTFFVMNADRRAVLAAKGWVKNMGEKAEFVAGSHQFQI
mgnify:CR=1 FL=1